MKFFPANLNVMIKAAQKASKILIRDFGEIEKLQVSLKGPGDFVTASDKKVEKILIEELQKARPDYSILSEEAGEINNKDKESRWIIDPIDGTLNFLHGIPHFGISIGLEHNGEIIAGIVFDPIKNELFSAAKGKGSYLNNQRIRASARKNLKDCIVFTGGPKFNSPNREKIFEEYKKTSNFIIAPIRKLGSAALDMSYVAAGRCDAFWQRNLNYWDIAAGVILIKEAGGFVTDFQGMNSYIKNKNILTTNSKITKEMIKILN